MRKHVVLILMMLGVSLVLGGCPTAQRLILMEKQSKNTSNLISCPILNGAVYLRLTYEECEKRKPKPKEETMPAS